MNNQVLSSLVFTLLRVRFLPVFLAAVVIGFGIFAYSGTAPSSVAQEAKCHFFSETGYRVCGRFLTYWQQHGALQQQGYPISEEFVEKSELDQKEYLVQYFERAVFEYHPEHSGTNYEVLLSQLGTLRFKAKYPNGTPGVIAFPTGTATPVPTATPLGRYNAEEDAAKHPSATPPAPLKSAFQTQYPGTSERMCVDVGQHGYVRSGEFVAGNFAALINNWRIGETSKLTWNAMHTDQDHQPGFTLYVVQRSDMQIISRFDFVTVALPGYFYPSGFYIPTTGNWRLVAKSGPDWGCFDLSL